MRFIPTRRGTCKKPCANARRNSRQEGCAPACFSRNSASRILPLKSVPIGSRCGPTAWWAASPTPPAFARPWPLPKNLSSLGIDSEITGSVRRELWRGICTPAETAWLRSLPGVEQLAAATLIFSAKEAFYKCQFPLTQERLGFHDVAVELPAWGDKRGAFKIIAQRPIVLEYDAAMPPQGRYLFHEQFITSGMAV